MDVPLELITSFLTITALETILAIDNLLFIYLVTAKLPVHQQRKAQITAISLAAIMRIVSLLFISLIMQWTIPIFSIFGNGISIKDMILIIGGLFLLCKALHEIYLLYRPKTVATQVAKNMLSAIAQIILIDAVFSIDSVITAIGLSDNIFVIAASILASCAIMLLASRFLIKSTHSLQLKLIALTSLIFIGLILMAAGIDIVIDKSYLLVALGFSIIIFIFQTSLKRKT
ncbi:MAG: TerC family protein [Proteobacteria bacterium]|nr:TerC family protein [Pseudomonadota bacterium]